MEKAFKELILALKSIANALIGKTDSSNNDNNDENINYDEIFIKLAKACNINGSIPSFQNLKKIIVSSEDIEQNNYTLVAQPDQKYLDANTKLGEIDYTLEDFLTEDQFNILKSYVQHFDGLDIMTSYERDEDHNELDENGYPDYISISNDDWETLSIGYGYVDMWTPTGGSNYSTSSLWLFLGSTYNKDRKICKLEFFG